MLGFSTNIPEKNANQIQTTLNGINKKIKRKHKKRAQWQKNENNFTLTGRKGKSWEENPYYAFMKWDEIEMMKETLVSSLFFSVCANTKIKRRHNFYMRIMHVGDDVEHVSSDKTEFV